MAGQERTNGRDAGPAPEREVEASAVQASPSEFDFAIQGIADPTEVATLVASQAVDQRATILQRVTFLRGNAFATEVIDSLREHMRQEDAAAFSGTAQEVSRTIAKLPEAQRTAAIRRVRRARGGRFAVDVEAEVLRTSEADPMVLPAEGEFDYQAIAVRVAVPSLDGSRQVIAMLARSSGAEIGVILEALEKDGLLDNFLKPLPFGDPKRLAEVIPHGQGHAHVLSRLRPYFENKAGADVTVTGLLKRIPYAGTPLAYVFDGLTLGFASEHDAAFKAKQEGAITEDEYVERSDHAGARAAVVGATVAVTGGSSAAYAEGATAELAASGTAGRMASTTAVGAAGGAGAGFGAQLGSDAVDGELSSPGDYARSTAIGLGLGVAGGALAGALGETVRHLPPRMQERVTAFASRFPTDAEIFAHWRGVGRQHARTIRITAGRLSQLIANGGATLEPRLLAATAGLAPDAPLSITGELVDGDGPPLHISQAERLDDELVELLDPDRHARGGAFDDIGDDLAEHADDVIDPRDLPPSHRDLVDEHEGGLTVRSRSDAQQSGIVPDEGAVYTDQHHVFPDEHREWFADPKNVQQPFDVDDFTLDIEHELHSTMHAGRGQWEGEWNARSLKAYQREQLRVGRPLAHEELLAIAREELDRFQVPDAPYRRYTGTKDTAARRKAKEKK